jgi:hypothetical protein
MRRNMKKVPEIVKREKPLKDKEEKEADQLLDQIEE